MRKTIVKKLLPNFPEIAMKLDNLTPQEDQIYDVLNRAPSKKEALFYMNGYSGKYRSYFAKIIEGLK